jgi:hypothetical protein
MNRKDIECLADEIIYVAQHLLEKQGEFFPFAEVMDNNGKITIVGAYTGEEHPKSQELIDGLISGLRKMANNGEISAAGLGLDTRITDPATNKKSDAICARLENRNAEAIEVYLPYTKGILGKPRFGEIIIYKGTISIFTKQ